MAEERKLALIHYKSTRQDFQHCCDLGGPSEARVPHLSHEDEHCTNSGLRFDWKQNRKPIVLTTTAECWLFVRQLRIQPLREA